MVTLAALTMASPAASAATYPLVSINPIALSAIADFLSVRAWPGSAGPGWGRVDGADDERVDGRRLAGEPRGRDRALDDQHPLAHAAAEHVERDQPLPVALGLHLEERTAGQAGHAAGRPHASDHRREIGR